LPALSFHDSTDIGIADLIELTFSYHFDLQIIQAVLQVKAPRRCNSAIFPIL
jgi:hypothetical protein